jgi:hypothetical protein
MSVTEPHGAVTLPQLGTPQKNTRWLRWSRCGVAARMNHGRTKYSNSRTASERWLDSCRHASNQAHALMQTSRRRRVLFQPSPYLFSCPSSALLHTKHRIRPSPFDFVLHLSFATMTSPTRKRKAAATPATSSKKTRSITSFFAPTPKSVNTDGQSSGSSLPTALPKFDKAAWVSSLSEEQKSLLALEIETMHDSWLAVLKDELVSDSFLNLKKFLSQEKGIVYPPSKDIYSWSRYCPLNTVKVVILGQDPYRMFHFLQFLSVDVR